MVRLALSCQVPRLSTARLIAIATDRIVTRGKVEHASAGRVSRYRDVSVEFIREKHTNRYRRAMLPRDDIEGNENER